MSTFPETPKGSKNSKPNTVTSHTGQIGNVVFTHRHTSRDADANSPSGSVPVTHSNPSGGWFSYFQGLYRRTPPTPQIRWVLELKTEFFSRSGTKVEDSIELEFSSREEAENHAHKWCEKSIREGTKAPYVINIYPKGHPPPEGQTFQPYMSYHDPSIHPLTNPMLPNRDSSEADASADTSNWEHFSEANPAEAPETDKPSKQ